MLSVSVQRYESSGRVTSVTEEEHSHLFRRFRRELPDKTVLHQGRRLALSGSNNSDLPAAAACFCRIDRNLESVREAEEAAL
jgi:hypothetical protein